MQKDILYLTQPFFLHLYEQYFKGKDKFEDKAKMWLYKRNTLKNYSKQEIWELR